MDRARSYLEADVNHIVRALADPRGVLTRDQLFDEVGGSHWSRGRFRRAVRAAVEQGRVREVAGEFYELTESERSGLP